MSSFSTVLLLSALIAPAAETTAETGDVGNRLTYLDEFCDPYYVGRDTPKLTTPQWVGRPGVEAVIVLAIDDLRQAAKYEAYLRPILDRLAEIDPDAGLSVMTNETDLDDPQLRKWLAENVNLETHTWTHPCPCLQKNDFPAAKATFDQCVDALGRATEGRSVAYRMPCCDSMNSVSPRFFTEIFNRTTSQGRFLAIDSSIFQVFTADDPQLPRELVFDEDGAEKFRKYVPTDRVMANLIEDYPYPYVIGRQCWEIPCLMPSDWDAQHLHGVCSPATVRDLKAAVDAVVVKQGVFSLCFHPHGWIENSQVIEMIDYAHEQYGGKVRFLHFGEVLERLNRNLLGGRPLRAEDGRDNGVRLLDLNNDGRMDVLVGNEKTLRTRVWSPQSGRWDVFGQPARFVLPKDASNDRPGGGDAGVRFGVFLPSGVASMFVPDGRAAGLWHFAGSQWRRDETLGASLPLSSSVAPKAENRDQGHRFRDLDRDGVCELIVGAPGKQAVFRLTNDGWRPLPFRLPRNTAIVDSLGRDAGLRFVDFDQDGYTDVVFSDAVRFSAHLFKGMTEGWSRTTLQGLRGDQGELPMIVRGDGTNNGAWFKYGHMWVQNEETGAALPDHVESRSYKNDLLGAEKEPPP